MAGNTEDTLREQILGKIEGVGEEGLSNSDLRTAEPESTDRKLRYRLGKLQEEGAIEKIGKGRATNLKRGERCVVGDAREKTTGDVAARLVVARSLAASIIIG